ncbi:hypothetical protein [Aeromonas bestiarum]|uniref:hypothetical protein n=1 Tax=Aeromonas bestiarum TaxID=105751 RepID=UPI0032B16FFD
MASSFGIWATGSENAAKINQVHINLWTTASPKIRCIDIGINFSIIDEDNAEYLNINIPFKVKKSSIEDLSTKMVNSQDLLTAIFNDYVDLLENLKTKHSRIRFSSGDEIYLHLNIDFNATLSGYDKRVFVDDAPHNYTNIKFDLKSCLDGLAKLKKTGSEKNKNNIKLDLKSCFGGRSRLNEIENDKEHYIRFRIPLDETAYGSMIHTIKGNDGFLKPFKEQLDVVDFRINEIRVLPKEIKTSVAATCSTPQKYHLFIIRDESDEYQLSHSGSSYKKCRILEAETWRKYFEQADTSVSESKTTWTNGVKSYISKIIKSPKDPLPFTQPTMIYHWSKETSKESDNKITDFIAVAKFKSIKHKWYTVIIYIIVIMLISIFSCFCYDLLKVNIPCILEMTTPTTPTENNTD